MIGWVCKQGRPASNIPGFAIVYFFMLPGGELLVFFPPRESQSGLVKTSGMLHAGGRDRFFFTFESSVVPKITKSLLPPATAPTRMHASAGLALAASRVRCTTR